MSDQEKFQALREEWSALVDQFLETPEGQLVIFGLKDGEEEIFTTMLKTCADVLQPTDEVIEYFTKQREGIFLLAIGELQARVPDTYPDDDSASPECERLRDVAKDIAMIIIREVARTLEAFAPKLMSEIPLSDSVNQVFDLVSQPGFDVSWAFEDAPDGNPKEPETRETRRAPDEEIKSLVASTVDTPLIEPPSALTVPVESAKLGDIRGGNLNELLRAYSQAPCAPDSNPPPVSISLHPASPPPAPDPGVSLGIESSIPPPANDDEQSSTEDEAEIITGDLDDPVALHEVHEADLNSVLEELGPTPTPVNKTTRRP